MSQKHFIAIAAKLAELQPIDPQDETHTLWRATVIAMADVCASFNERFDRKVFYAACDFK
jgi:hypothetical protein